MTFVICLVNNNPLSKWAKLNKGFSVCVCVCVCLSLSLSLSLSHTHTLALTLSLGYNSHSIPCSNRPFIPPSRGPSLYHFKGLQDGTTRPDYNIRSSGAYSMSLPMGRPLPQGSLMTHGSPQPRHWRLRPAGPGFPQRPPSQCTTHPPVQP